METIAPASHLARTAPMANMRIIPESVVDDMRIMLRAQTPECIMATFGISMNTWVKIRDGHPIRRSVAERLLERLGRPLGDGPA
ncbi:hypothetical protein [Sphingobium aquiterrae]|uniref:hypothetical protein n=1 Tax=Sphingobium aquiterrae TaxID=2038656 RepID=UPI00301591A3